VDELLSLLTRYPYWPHRPRASSVEQHAAFARASLQGAELVRHHRGSILVAAVARQTLGWDTEKLGVPSARLSVIVDPDSVEVTASIVGEALASATSAGFGYLFTRVDARELATVQHLERAGFRTVDAIVSQYLRVGVQPGVSAAPSGIAVREATAADAALVEEMTDATLTQSRFHSDPLVGVEKARAMYREWARNSVSGLNELTLIAEVDGVPAGFLSCKDVRGAREAYGYGYCRIELVAVLEAFRGTGAVQALTANLLARCPAHGWALCGIGTQISNATALRAYGKAGFTPGDAIFSMRWRADDARHG